MPYMPFSATTPVRYPLTTGAFVCAVALGVWSIVTVFSGSRYIGALNFVDATTPLMISVLLLRGIYALRAAPDLKIFSITLICALSFVYTFEAVYKFFFFGWVPKPPELRELLLQIATGLTVLVAFQSRDLRLSGLSKLFLALYALTMLFWWSIGYPQLDSPPHMVQYITLHVSTETVYVINRFAKLFLFVAFFFFYEPGRRQMPPGSAA